MQLTLGHRSVASPDVTTVAVPASERAARTGISSAAAVACYCAGILIETLGLGLIAAYGMVLAGGLLAVCGFVLGTFENSRWPARQTVSLAEYVKDYLGATRR